jgi:hypothetical protein
METVGFAASIASIVLAVVAMILSVYFYTQAKNTEGAVTASLEAIRAQTDALQKLTGRWMDRLTRYVTTPQQERPDSNTHLLAAIRSLPTDIASQLRAPGHDDNVDRLYREVITSYIALYYYTSVANIWAQMALPPLDRYQSDPDRSNLVKQVVDESYRDFVFVTGLLERSDRTVIEAAPLQRLLQRTQNVNRHWVADATQVYARLAQAAESHAQDAAPSEDA